MSPRRFRASVDLPVSRELAYDYLGDPRNRPEWQSSLLSVSLPGDPEPHVGLRWRETTMVGVRPRLEIVEMDRPRRWVEVGRWQGVRATLALDFEERSAGCRVVAEGKLTGRGPYAVAAALAGRLAGVAIAADLRRAGRLLTRRG